MKLNGFFVLLLTLAFVLGQTQSSVIDLLTDVLQIPKGLLNTILALIVTLQPHSTPPSNPGPPPTPPSVGGKFCQFREYETGHVCVCNSGFCDTLEYGLPTNNGDVLIVSTSEGGLRFNQTTSRFNYVKVTIPNGPFKGSSSFLTAGKKLFSFLDPSVVDIEINRSKKYQNFFGFGGAFTGAVTYNLQQLLTQELRDFIYQSYYSNDVGIGYSFMRLPIGGCDFDFSPWAYNESPVGEVQLSNFTQLDQRDLERIDLIERLKNVSNNYDINFLGSAWSSPPWMKSNNDWTGFSSLKPEYYQTWADYHVKYFELMKEKNISFWGMTTGNEPNNGAFAFLFISFMSLGWVPANQGRWVGNNLGPTLNSSAFSNVKILAGDDQRFTFPGWFKKMFIASPASRDFVDGFAYHSYWDSIVPAFLLDQAVKDHPGKFIMSTESCRGAMAFEQHKPLLGDWSRLEWYVHNIIENLNHQVSGWLDWNLVLDPIGGTNYVENYVDSAIIVNVTEFYKQPIFYGLGQLSKFIIPGSIRLYSKSSRSSVETTAFLRPDGYVVLVLFNTAISKVDVKISDPTYGSLVINIPSKSVHTLIYK